MSRIIFGVAIIVGIGVVALTTRDRWLPRFVSSSTAGSESSIPLEQSKSATPSGKVLLSDQAITNLGLVARPIQPATYWKTIQIPGMIVDRPGRSDRSVVSPATGIVAKINFFPGDTVRSGEVLFSIRLMSETLHQTQADLFKAIQDIRLAESQRKRLASAKEAIPESRLIEVDNQLIRLELAVKTFRRELGNRGLSFPQIDEVVQGNFVNEITVHAPVRSAGAPALVDESIAGQAATDAGQAAPTFELQASHVELGQQVEAGQLLCLLANHQMLAIEGRAFRDETPLLEQSVKEGWPVAVDFQENSESGWPPLAGEYQIRHLANTIDPIHRTFAFTIPIENESRVVEVNGRTQILWRFRPGQKLRLMVRVKKLDDVYIVPADAVVQDGAEAYVFTQNVNTFTRRPVRIITQDRQQAVLAHDASLLPGSFVVQSAAAQLNCMAKSENSGIPKGFHIHADGSLHKNEDEGK